MRWHKMDHRIEVSPRVFPKCKEIGRMNLYSTAVQGRHTAIMPPHPILRHPLEHLSISASPSIHT